MVNRFSDTLFQLVRSLEKSEKRHFKLFIKRSSGNEDLKIIELFDALDKLIEYDEVTLLKKLKTIKKPQLSNIKVHLYKQLLASLRLLKSADSIDLQLNEQFDFAHILYKKGLYFHSLKILDKAKETAKANHKVNFLLQAITLEKRIESLHITDATQHRRESLAAEINEVNTRINLTSRLSNLAMLLYSWFIENGHTKNKEDKIKLEQFFSENLPPEAITTKGFYENLYLYKSYCWRSYIKQDFFNYYRHSQKWVNIFEDQPLLIRVETGHYIKGLNALLNAHFILRNYKKMKIVIKNFEDFTKTERVSQHDNFRIQSFIYLHIAKLNLHNMTGTFSEGIAIVPNLLEKLKAYELFIDERRIMLFNYKIASMYFGNGNYDICIDYVQKIINENSRVHNDLQSYARLLHLMAHYELGNYDLMEYLTKSVYRFMAKKQNFTLVEAEMFTFLRKSFFYTKKDMQIELHSLLQTIKEFEKSNVETRVFAYMDIITWLEAKVEKVTMSEILRKKLRLE
jgi:hypothetical protein